MAYFLGIDGGGTRTTAWLSDEKRRILARSVAGPSNPLKVGYEVTQRELLLAARQVFRRAGLRLPQRVPHQQARGKTGKGAKTQSLAERRRSSSPVLEAVCVGLAGSDRPQVRRPLSAWLKHAIPARHHLLTTDAAVALRAAAGDSPGVIVISGTGSIAYARDDRGRVLRAGGWGVPFDDAGSGYDLGHKAISAALRDYDGRGSYTQLTARICKALGLADITEIVAKKLGPNDVAALMPLVLEAARRRDVIARRLCEEAGQELAGLAIALLRRMGWLRRVVPVVYAGGVFHASRRVRQSVTRHLRRHAPQARVLLLRHPPVEGALALARDLAEGHDD